MADDRRRVVQVRETIAGHLEAWTENLTFGGLERWVFDPYRREWENVDGVPPIPGQERESDGS